MQQGRADVSTFYMVCSMKADLSGGNAPYSIYQWPGDAFDAAKAATTNDRLPRGVYAMELIAETEATVAKLTDYRPTAAKETP